MKKTLFLISALAALVSCTKEVPSTETPEQSETKIVTIVAGSPSDDDSAGVPATSSRTQIDNEGKVTWSAGDVVKVCFPTYNHYDSYGSYYGSTYLFTSQSEGGSKSALFQGEWATSSAFISYGFIMYPQTVEFSSVDNRGTFTTTFSYTLPEVQEAVDNTFAKDLNLAYAPVSKADMDANNANVTFKNLCALIKVVLPQEDYNIKSITIESTNTNGSGVMHGKATLSYASATGVVSVSGYPSSTPSVTLKKSDNSELTPGAAYYAVVWAKSHSALKLTFTDVNGNEATKQTPSGTVIYCNAGQYHTLNIKSLSFDTAPYLNVGTTSITPSAKGATNSFFVNANNSWSTSVAYGSNDGQWLTVTEDHSSGTVVVAAAENTTPNVRTATITVTSADLTETVTVSQPPVYYRSSTGTPISAATELKDGSLYMIYFATGSSSNQIQNYCWKVDSDGNVTANYVDDRTANTTNDCVFKLHKTSITSWQSYNAVASGYLQSEYNDMYQVLGGNTILDFAGASQSDAVELIFGNQWPDTNSSTGYEQGSDIDIWNSSSQTIYWSGGTSRTSGSLSWTTNTGNVPRKWFLVEVQEVE